MSVAQLDPVPLCDVHCEPMSVHVLGQPNGAQWYVRGCDSAGCGRYFDDLGYFVLADSQKDYTVATHPRCSLDARAMYVGRVEGTKTSYYCVDEHPNRGILT